MTVYVDDMEAAFGPMKMCHMLADSDEDGLEETIAGFVRQHGSSPPTFALIYSLSFLQISGGSLRR